MLTSLRIENFAIVSQLELDFAPGMTAFTGETGAGKSIMIDALMLALGGRADASVIRVGAEKCEIHACFSFDANSQPADWLKAHDALNDEGEIILRRVLYPEGRSKSYINGQPFPLQKVKELSETLVDIHGQHQHQRLLNHATHREQLDEYAQHAPLLFEVNQAYRQCQQLKHALEGLKNQTANNQRVAELHAQEEELLALDLKEGEAARLHDEHQLLHHACEYLTSTQNITERLQADDAPSVMHGLNYSLQCIASLPQEHPRIKNATELLNSALIQCDEALDELTKFSTEVQLQPERLQEIEARISVLHKAARKYHVETSQLNAYLAQVQHEILTLQQSAQQQHQREEDYKRSQHTYEQAAFRLRASRLQVAKQMEQDISLIIKQLGMPHGYLRIQLTPLDKMHAHGLDKVEYTVCTNPGMLPDTLAKIASGGELSRISLAIQMIAAQRGATPTLLFDEVDVGIGGSTAALVGQMLRNLGERLQLFCVTHQPQVASCAHYHFRVEKYTEAEKTFSRVIPLESNDKIDEIARMLGGLTITEQTLAHAKELLVQSCGA